MSLRNNMMISSGAISSTRQLNAASSIPDALCQPRQNIKHKLTRKQQPQPTTDQARKKERSFVTANNSSTAITSAAPGLSWRNKITGSEAARDKLEENDKRLAGAIWRLEILARILCCNSKRKTKELAAAKEKRLKVIQQQTTDHRRPLIDLDRCSTDGYDGEGVSLDFVQDDPKPHALPAPHIPNPHPST
ncbi:hypothetical protein BC830DRAFT_1076637 [Chytriomyces sp. MP71]|nr:hypothetical protein BC830DRAFT_1076637 [Chytriomyces sp. MP71]